MDLLKVPLEKLAVEAMEALERLYQAYVEQVGWDEAETLPIEACQAWLRDRFGLVQVEEPNDVNRFAGRYAWR